MSLTFWDTVRGVHLADTITRYLPLLVKGLKPKKQSVYRITGEAESREVFELISSGKMRFAGSYRDLEGKPIVILEEAADKESSF